MRRRFSSRYSLPAECMLAGFIGMQAELSEFKTNSWMREGFTHVIEPVQV